jgi:phage shock protein E
MWRTTKHVLAGVCLAVGAASIARAEILWIDVRSPEEHTADRIEGDPNLPHDEVAARIGTLTTDRNAEIALYCSGGVRSFVAARRLSAMGYQRVRNAGTIEDVRKQRGL